MYRLQPQTGQDDTLSQMCATRECLKRTQPLRDHRTQGGMGTHACVNVGHLLLQTANLANVLRVLSSLSTREGVMCHVTTLSQLCVANRTRQRREPAPVYHQHYVLLDLGMRTRRRCHLPQRRHRLPGHHQSEAAFRLPAAAPGASLRPRQPRSATALSNAGDPTTPTTPCSSVTAGSLHAVAIFSTSRSLHELHYPSRRTQLCVRIHHILSMQTRVCMP